MTIVEPGRFSVLFLKERRSPVDLPMLKRNNLSDLPHYAVCLPVADGKQRGLKSRDRGDGSAYSYALVERPEKC